MIRVNYQHEQERQELISECHGLIALIAQQRYGVRLLRAAREGLLLYLDYKRR